MNLGEKIDRLYAIKQSKAELNAQLSTLDAEFETIEAEVLASLREVGLDSAKATTASATISESVVPNVEDWDAFGKYIIETDALFLIQRRVSVTAYRDLLQAGENVPGVSPYTDVKLSLRKLSN